MPLIANLFPEQIGFVDGTYHKCEKSQHFDEQRKSYCQHKGYNLLKTLSLLTVDGRWWDLLGVFYSDSNHNDELLYEDVILEDLQGCKTFIDNHLIMADRSVV